MGNHSEAEAETSAIAPSGRCRSSQAVHVAPLSAKLCSGVMPTGHAATTAGRLQDIVAAAKLTDTKTGDTLSAVDGPIQLESLTFPAPVISVAIEPRTKGDQDKLGEALAKYTADVDALRAAAA